MKLYNTDKQSRVIDYFIKNFIHISRIKHKNLLESHQFNIIKTIDRKKVNINQYYTTTEYIDKPKLDELYLDLTLQERLHVILQVCTVLDFLHYKGIVYKHLSPLNIYVLDDGTIKITDLASIYENLINVSYDDLTRYFIAPEVLLNQQDMINENADKYSLGMLMKYLLTKDFYIGVNTHYEYRDEEDLKDEQIEFLNNTINNLTRKNAIIRNASLRDIIKGIKEVFSIEYENDLVEERGILNFKTKIIGREREIERVVAIDDNLIENKDYKRAILVDGDTGVGKTRFLKEITYILRMRGRDAYYTEIDINNRNLKAITSILRQTIKDTPKIILDKYGEELAKLLPELKFSSEMDSFGETNGYRQRLRLYDRITNFFREISKDRPTYLIIDNIDYCQIEFFHFLDYLLNNMGQGNIVLILSYNQNKLPEESNINDFINRWSKQEDIERIKLGNLDLSEIGEFIQHILGISYKPLKFSAVMLKESQGNPGYIEYMIKNLYVTGELYFDPEGFWEIKTQRYSDIYFPSSIDEAIKSQIGLIEKEYMDIMKIVAVYNESVSKNILQQMLDMDTDILNNKLNELIGMRLLDERLADWGYSYSINSLKLKKLIYHQIPEEERIKLHKRLAQLLEKNYGEGYSPVMDKLIYHLISSNQMEKALKYIVEGARRYSNKFNSQAVILWEEAYEIAMDMESGYIFEILEALGEIYYMKGQNEKALEMYRQLIEEANKGNKLEYAIKANIGIGEIYLKRNLTQLALQEAEKSIDLSKQAGYLEGYVLSNILFNKILINNGKFEEVKDSMEELLRFSTRNNIDKGLGDIYNLMGLAQYFIGNIEEAINNYKMSIEYFQKMGQFINSTKPMNNIANIYTQQGDYEKAMEYYEEALTIVDKYEILNLKLVFLNNIGEIYKDLCDYSRAKEYIEQAKAISVEIEDVNLIFLTNINLGLLYLLTNEYEQSYNCYLTIKESYVKNQNLDFEIISQYYNFIGEFYYAFGVWDKAIEYSERAANYCKSYNNTECLMAISRTVLAKYFRDRKYDKDSIGKIITQFMDINLPLHKRKVLLNLSIIAFLEKDYQYVEEILKEDEELRKDNPSPNLDYLAKILSYSIDQEKNSYMNILKLEEDLKKYNLTNLSIFANTIIGYRFAEDDKYYEAINYLLETLDSIYKQIRNIPDRQLQINYIKSKGGDQIKRKINELISKDFGKKIDCLTTDDLYSNINIQEYFDYGPLLSLIDDNKFAKIVEINYLYDEFKNIYGIEDLLANLTKDYEYNLKLILKYLAKETLAQRGYILIFDNESNRYIPMISLNDDLNWTPNVNLLSIANRYEKGILINNKLGNNIIGLYREFLGKDIRALLCIPIAISRASKANIKEERRKSQPIGVRNEGYIYLESDRIFNRFDGERHNLVYNLVQLLYINIDNYKLKTLSSIDKLTGTYTRKYFENEFNNVLNEAKETNSSFALLMIDIDRFKNINDMYGHRKGDEALNRIGSTLMSNIRSTDMVARYGGEEFVVILKNVQEEEAKKIGDKIRENIASIRIPSIEVPITISIGISIFPQHSQFMEELIEKADQALYCAKESGRNNVVVWDTHLSDTLNRMDRLAGILSGDINKDERNILAMLDIVELIQKEISKEEKIFIFLGRVIEILEAQKCILIHIDQNGEILKSYARSRKTKEWLEEFHINTDIVDKVIKNKKGEFLIDWESVNERELLLNTPNWESVIVIPLIRDGILKGVVYIGVPIKEKEFDYNSYNLAKSLCDIFASMI
ncbi:MAG: diguanylate cyclase [Tissierellia bacterium]|nr:diguanylate cyclase [Tissierellia bacterium]